MSDPSSDDKKVDSTGSDNSNIRSSSAAISQQMANPSSPNSFLNSFSDYLDIPLRQKSAYDSGLKEVWNRAKCGDVIRRQKPILLDSQLSVVKAIEVLSTNNISSAPVLDAKSDCYIRVLDFRDLAGTILQFVNEMNSPLTNNSQVLDSMLDKISLQIVPDNFHQDNDLTKQQPFFCVKENQPLYDAIKLFTQKITKAKVHRIVILSANSQDSYSKDCFLGILSQTDAINFIHTQLGDERVKAIVTKSLNELKLVQSEIISIKDKKTVLDALSLMNNKNLSSLAVVNDTRALVGVISFSNIRYLFGKKLYSELKQKCGDFVIQLQKSKAKSIHYELNHEIISPESSLTDCIKRLVAHHLHRVWVVDNQFRPVGVVSLTDVLRALA